MTTDTAPLKIEQGSEMHFTVLMAPYHLNFVVGDDRQALLAFAADVWGAALASRDASGEPPVAYLRSIDDMRLLAFAYRKLSPYTMSNEEDALLLDEIKLILMGAL